MMDGSASPSLALPEGEGPAGELESGHGRAWRRLRHNRLFWVGAGFTTALVLAALLASKLAPYPPNAMNLGAAFLPPSPQHWAGTDQFGRDQLSRILYGARISLKVGVISVGIGLVAGSLIGAVSGYIGGVVDLLIQRLVDMMLAFPGLLLALMIIAILGPGLTNAMIAIGIGSVPAYARLVRGQVLAIRERDHVEAERALGASHARVLFRHILPGALSPVIVLAALGTGGAILAAAALSYIGLGAQPPSPDWGAMLAQNQQFIADKWWLPTLPGLAIVFAVLGFNLLGDGLRDWLSPR